MPAAIVIAVLMLAAVHFMLWVTSNSEFSSSIFFYAAFIPARLTEMPMAYTYSLASYSLLHGSFGHLINNCVWLLAFGSPVASLLGNFRFLIFWMACATAAALIHFGADPISIIPMIGASGAVSGMMGAVARAGFRLVGASDARQTPFRLPSIGTALKSRKVVVFVLVYLLVNIGIGFGQANDPGVSAIAWQAHIGGLLAGFFLFPLFVPKR